MHAPALNESEIAYEIKDRNFATLRIRKTDSGWWKSSETLRTFITCFKNGWDLKTAWNYIGISKDQYYYFIQLHPEFSEVIEACYELGVSVAESNVHEFLQEKDKETTRWYLERRKSWKYGRQLAMGEGNTGNVINNFGTIINQKLGRGDVPDDVYERIKAEEESVATTPLSPTEEVSLNDSPTDKVSHSDGVGEGSQPLQP